MTANNRLCRIRRRNEKPRTSKEQWKLKVFPVKRVNSASAYRTHTDCIARNFVKLFPFIFSLELCWFRLFEMTLASIAIRWNVSLVLFFGSNNFYSVCLQFVRFLHSVESRRKIIIKLRQTQKRIPIKRQSKPPK